MSNQEALQILESLPPFLKKQAMDYLKLLKSRMDNKGQKGGPIRKAGAMKGFVTYMATDFDAPIEDMKDYM